MRIQPAESRPPLPRKLITERPSVVESPAPADTVDPPWSSLQRPVRQLERLPDGRVRVDTVRWSLGEEGDPLDWPGVFGDASLDPSKVKNVYLGIKPFYPEPLAAHGVLVFEMEEGHSVQRSDGQTDPALVLSMEARLPQGEAYSLKKTLNGNYGVVYQLQTWKDLVQKTGRREGLQQILYRLDLSAEQSQQLLEKSLEAAAAPRDGERYHLFGNACQSAVIDLLNEVVEDERQIRRYLLPGLYNPLTMFPAQADIVFAGHQLLAHQERMIVQADTSMHPDKIKVPGKVERVLRQASSSAAWTPLCTAGGALGGAMAGLALQQLPPLLALPGGAVLGAGLGHFFAETTRRRTQSQFVTHAEAMKLSPSQAFEVSERMPRLS